MIKVFISLVLGFVLGFVIGVFPWRFYFEGGTPHVLVTDFQYSAERLVNRGGGIYDPQKVARHAVYLADMNATFVARTFCRLSKEDRAWAAQFARLLDTSPLVEAFGSSDGKRAREFIEAHETAMESCRNFDT
jgi:hypothetical protein